MKNSDYNVFYNREISFVANTMTGACFLLSKDELDHLVKEDFGYFNNDQLRQLKNSGIIISKSLDEKKLLRYAYQKAKADTDIARIIIAFSLSCNMACSYCFERKKHYIMNDKDIGLLLQYIIDFVEINRIKGLNICWFGGEPLLCVKQISSLSNDLIYYCNKTGINYTSSIVTNGYLVRKELIEHIREWKIDTVQITLDGSKEIHNKRRPLVAGGDSYTEICEGIRLLDKAKVKTRIRVNIDKSNIDEYEIVHDSFREFDYVTCYPAMVTVEDTQSSEQRSLCFGCNERSMFYDRFQLFESTDYSPGICNCLAEHDNSFLVDPDGYIYKCLNDIGNPIAAIDHINKRIDGTLSTSKYLGRDPFSEDECADCKFIPMCYGGCVYEYLRQGTHLCNSVKYSYLTSCRNKIYNTIKDD